MQAGQVERGVQGKATVSSPGNPLSRRDFLCVSSAALLQSPAQSPAPDLDTILGNPLLTPELVTDRLRQYLHHRIPQLGLPSTSAAWTAQAERIREHLLRDVIFRGLPREWVESPPKFEDLGTFGTGTGYRMRKLRYEIVPGFQSTAILYEPDSLSGKIPAVLNPNGHEIRRGKAAEYKQKRCITLARHGMLALNLEWLGCGELNLPENEHTSGAHLDLVGVNSVGLFYLAMRRGLDYLDRHPHADRNRLAVTGLSGGGWQTIVLSALDPRVSVAIPVAGYSAMTPKLERPVDVGDNEQASADFLDGQDYSHLTAMRAPRPTLLIYNAEDDCCFRAPLTKPYVYDAVKPFFRLYGKEDAFAWHENTDPGTHNYQLDNRLQAYRFLSRHFGLPPITGEIPEENDVKSAQELRVGLPQDNLTILGLARQFAGKIAHEPAPSGAGGRSRWATDARKRLQNLVRYQGSGVEHVAAVANTKHRGVETLSWRVLFGDQLEATAVWAHAIGVANSPATIILDDGGKRAAGEEVSELVSRGEQVIALDTIFHGDAIPEAFGAAYYVLLLSATGRRALGIEAAQLIGVAHWMRERTANAPLHLRATGLRSQVTALVAAALEPELFADVLVRDGMRSLQHLITAPVRFQDAPDLFCFGLYKEFDIDILVELAGNTRVTQHYLEGRG